LIPLFKQEETSWDCRKLAEAAAEGNSIIVTSAIGLVEVAKGEGTRSAMQAIADFFENPFIEVVELDRRLALLARNAYWEHGIHPHDAVHLVTAIDSGCDRLWTTDPHLLKHNGIANLAILRPKCEGQLGLPDTTPKAES